MRKSRIHRVRAAASRYACSFATPAHELEPRAVDWRIRYAFVQGADHERRHTQRQAKRRART